jgi:hypothetical protein
MTKIMIHYSLWRTSANNWLTATTLGRCFEIVAIFFHPRMIYHDSIIPLTFAYFVGEGWLNHQIDNMFLGYLSYLPLYPHDLPSIIYIYPYHKSNNIYQYIYIHIRSYIVCIYIIYTYIIYQLHDTFHIHEIPMKSIDFLCPVGRWRRAILSLGFLLRRGLGLGDGGFGGVELERLMELAGIWWNLMEVDRGSWKLMEVDGS